MSDVYRPWWVIQEKGWPGDAAPEPVAEVVPEPAVPEPAPEPMTSTDEGT